MLTGLSHSLQVANSLLASALELGRGAMVVAPATPPEQLLELYEFEACPFCRAVREALTALHLDARIHPCPKGGTRFRPEAVRLGGKAQFPLLVDRNRDKVMYESAAIVAYLFETYGGRAVPAAYRASKVRIAAGSLASGVRGMRGTRARPSKLPAQPLRLWSFEASPYSRLVRERLCELELPYELHNLGKEHWTELGPAVQRLTLGPYVPQPGGKREAFFRKTGRVQLPYLEDPNTGTELFESAAIVEYLERTYAA